jgi:hypothetical protein
VTDDDSRIALDIRLNWFRSLPMSCLDVLDLWIDGVPVDPASRKLTYDGQTLRLDQWARRDDVGWSVVDSATLTAAAPKRLTRGQHTVQLDISVRIPSFAQVRTGPGRACSTASSRQRKSHSSRDISTTLNYGNRT